MRTQLFDDVGCKRVYSYFFKYKASNASIPIKLNQSNHHILKSTVCFYTNMLTQLLIQTFFEFTFIEPVSASVTLLQGYSLAPGPGIKSLPSFNSCIGSLSTTAFNTKSFYQTYLPLNSKPTPFVSQLSVFLESSHPGFAPWVTGLSVWQSPNSGMPCRL